MFTKKFIGKPYAGNPHVRFDEGAGKGFQSFPLYSTALVRSSFRLISAALNNHRSTTSVAPSSPFRQHRQSLENAWVDDGK
jgi:hypothetical protein